MPTTHNIKQLGFSGLRGFCFQANFTNGGYRSAPKTQPFHIVNRYRQVVEKNKMQKGKGLLI